MQHAILYHPFTRGSRGRSSREAYLGANWLVAPGTKSSVRVPFFRRIGLYRGKPFISATGASVCERFVKLHSAFTELKSRVRMWETCKYIMFLLLIPL